MTPYPAVSTTPVTGVGALAARTLTAEFARQNAAASALLVVAEHASTVVAAAFDPHLAIGRARHSVAV